MAPRTHTVDIVYEDPDKAINCNTCQEWATPGVRRLYDSWVNKTPFHSIPGLRVNGIPDRPRCYIYPIGLFHTPSQWAGPPVPMHIRLGDGQGPFMHVDARIMHDARDGRVLFIMDQSQEGNADPMLWEWFYRHCSDHGIPPENVVYLTSDHFAEKRHSAFCDAALQHRRVWVISSLFNMHTLSDMMSKTVGVTEWDMPDSKPYLFNCLNRMGHQHRRWLFLEMLEAGLLPYGMVSMDRFTDADPLPGKGAYPPDLLARAAGMLPLVVDNSDFSKNMYNNLNREIYDSSWFTVITETYVDDNQLLIGEKVFKPMMCFSPFMVLGTCGTLDRLRQLGFMTFPMLWDESYDSMPIGQRVPEIARQVSIANGIADKRNWIAMAEEALRHNHRLAWTSWLDGRDISSILAIWEDFAIKSRG